MLVFHLPLISSPTLETIQRSYISGDNSSNTVGGDASSPLERRLAMKADAVLEFHPQLNKTTKLSMAFWFKKPGSEAPTDWGQYLVSVITKASDLGTGEFRLEKLLNSEGYGLFNNAHFTSPGGGAAFSFDVPTNQWRHFAVSVDADTGDWEYWLFNPADNTCSHYNGRVTDGQRIYFDDIVRVKKPGQVTEIDYADVRVYDHRVSQYEVEQMQKRLVCQYCFDEIE